MSRVWQRQRSPARPSTQLQCRLLLPPQMLHTSRPAGICGFSETSSPGPSAENAPGRSGALHGALLLHPLSLRACPRAGGSCSSAAALHCAPYQTAALPAACPIAATPPAVHRQLPTTTAPPHRGAAGLDGRDLGLTAGHAPVRWCWREGVRLCAPAACAGTHPVRSARWCGYGSRGMEEVLPHLLTTPRWSQRLNI